MIRDGVFETPKRPAIRSSWKEYRKPLGVNNMALIQQQIVFTIKDIWKNSTLNFLSLQDNVYIFTIQRYTVICYLALVRPNYVKRKIFIDLIQPSIAFAKMFTSVVLIWALSLTNSKFVKFTFNLFQIKLKCISSNLIFVLIFSSLCFNFSITTCKTWCFFIFFTWTAIYI